MALSADRLTLLVDYMKDSIKSICEQVSYLVDSHQQLGWLDKKTQFWLLLILHKYASYNYMAGWFKKRKENKR